VVERLDDLYSPRVEPKNLEDPSSTDVSWIDQTVFSGKLKVSVVAIAPLYLARQYRSSRVLAGWPFDLLECLDSAAGLVDTCKPWLRLSLVGKLMNMGVFIMQSTWGSRLSAAFATHVSSQQCGLSKSALSSWGVRRFVNFFKV